jgi:hypothetical protein
MKNLIIGITGLFLIVTEARASVWPRVLNFGDSVQVQLDNFTDNDVNCSGWVYMNLSSGSTAAEYVFEYVPRRSFRFRSLRPYPWGTRINFVHHSIFCR